MDCSKAEKFLVEYLYQELSPEKTVQIEKHLEVCDACSKTLENWRAIHRGYQRAEDVPPAPPYMNQRILAAAREEATRKPSFAERLVVLMKPAIVLPVLIFGILVVLILPVKTKQMAEAPEPAAIQAPSPAVAQREKAPAGSESDEMKRLKALGYVSDEKKASEQPMGDFTGRKAESTDYRERDADALKLKKDAPYSKGGAPADAVSGLEEQKEGGYAANEAYQYNEPEPSLSDTQERQDAAPPAAPAAKPTVALKTQAPAQKQAFSDDKIQNFQRAQVDFQKNEFSSGKDAAEVAIKQDKEGALAPKFHAAGREYQSQGLPEQAIVQYNLVLNNYPSYPESPDVLMRLAESYEQIGAYDQAIKAYQQLQRNSRMRKVAGERIDSLSKKQQVQEQLRSLGYVDDKQ